MDSLQEVYVSDEDCTLGTVAVVAEIESEDADGTRFSVIHFRCSDGRRWVQRALFREAHDATYPNATVEEEGGDEL